MGRVRRTVLESAAAIQRDLQSSGVRYRAALVTCTYRPGVAWSPRHLTGALKSLNEWSRRRGGWVRNVWRLEFTKRGVPHYHVVCWLPKGTTMPKWDNRGWWPHGMTNAKWARSPVGYIAKYAAKDADWPPGTCGTVGARWCGAGGLSVALRVAIRWACAPAWLRGLGWDTDTPLRRVGSRWRVGAWLYRSPWSVVELIGGYCEFRWRGWDDESAVLVA
jgi:hypothetical protein